MADALLGIETDSDREAQIRKVGFTLADALLGIETFLNLLIIVVNRFTLADALLGIETVVCHLVILLAFVSLWLMPF